MRRHLERRFKLVLKVCAALLWLGLFSGPVGAFAQADQRWVALGPDGSTYVVSWQMDVTRPVGEPRGIECTLTALDPAKRLLWNYPIEDGTPLAPAVRSDGTVYVTILPARGYSEPGSAGEPEVSRLCAIRGGSLKWSMEFEGQVLSAPVLGPDGTVYFTTHCSFLGEMSGSATMDPCRGKGGVALFAVVDRPRVAGIRWSQEIDAPMLSEPVVNVINPTLWTIAVAGNLRTSGGMGGEKMGVPTLFQFRPDGSFTTIRVGH